MTPGRRDDEGTALVEFLWLGMLLLIPLAYIVVSLFQVERTAFAVSDAARAAGRAWVGAPAGADRPQRALAAAQMAFDDQGITLPPGGMEWDCDNNCCPGTGTLHVVIKAHASLPGLAALARSAGEIPVTGSHAEVIDRFAAGPTGCP